MTSTKDLALQPGLVAEPMGFRWARPEEETPPTGGAIRVRCRSWLLDRGTLPLCWGRNLSLCRVGIVGLT